MTLDFGELLLEILDVFFDPRPPRRDRVPGLLKVCQFLLTLIELVLSFLNVLTTRFGVLLAKLLFNFHKIFLKTLKTIQPEQSSDCLMDVMLPFLRGHCSRYESLDLVSVRKEHVLESCWHKLFKHGRGIPWHGFFSCRRSPQEFGAHGPVAELISFTRRLLDGSRQNVLLCA